MHVEDFPHPKNDNRRGVHWSASVYHPKGKALDPWIAELQALNIKWVKLLDDSGGSSTEVCERLLAADIMPIVRLYRFAPNPDHMGGREAETVRSLVAKGVRYFETNNEPDLAAEWKDQHKPDNWLEIVVDNFISDADTILSLGGLPAFPAMGVGSKTNPLALLVEKGREDLFDHGAWLAIHNYTLNHPLDYPYDAVNQQGEPVSQEEYDALGPWSWDNHPRELINQWRAADKNPGKGLADDAACFLGFQLADEMATEALGYKIPILSTEGGPVIGWRDDRRYPRIGPQLHAEWVVAINDFLQGNSQINGLFCPDNYFTMCYWLLGNSRLGFLDITWESQSWYSDWWNTTFGLKGHLPVVDQVKAMPSVAVDVAQKGVISGTLLRADTGEPLANLRPQLLAGGVFVASSLSAADGSFRFEGLRLGSYDLSIDSWGIVERGLVAGSAQAEPLVIRLEGGGKSSLSVMVVDHEGAPGRGTHLVLRQDGAVMGEGDTGVDGTFRFDSLSVGLYEAGMPGIVVSGIALDGWAGKSIKLTRGLPASLRYAGIERRLLSAGETTDQNMFLGTVVDTEGQPLNGIKLQMSWEGAGADTQFPTTVTGRNPFRPPGSTSLCIREAYSVFRWCRVIGPATWSISWIRPTCRGERASRSPMRVSFQLKPTGTPARVDGRITGAPVGSRLALTPLSGAPASEGASSEAAIEAAPGTDGAFAFAGLAPGSYRLDLSGIGTIAPEIQLEPGGLFTLLFAMRSRVQGQVSGGTGGQPVTLQAQSPWDWARQSPLGPDGRFAFDGLPAGRYRLQVADQAVPDLLLTGENAVQIPVIDLLQGRHGVLHGRVADPSGRSEPDVLMTLRPRRRSRRADCTRVSTATTVLVICWPAVTRWRLRAWALWVA